MRILGTGLKNTKSVLLLLSFICLSCGHKKDTPPQDGETGDAPDIQVEGDGIEEALDCTQDSDCYDGNPCNGIERCDLTTGRCTAGEPVEDGTVCRVEPRGICLAGLCTESICGDGFLDTGGGEYCEPPGEGTCDGNCSLPCEGDEDCLNDGNVCNGEEYCNVDTQRCSRRNPHENGTVCRVEPRKICLAGSCTESICGDGFLDTGADESCEPPGEEDCDETCGWICGEDENCSDDGNICNGEEYCNHDTQRCSRRDPRPDGSLCALEPRAVCLMGLCTTSICGDGFLDIGAGEFCEPPGEGDCGENCRWLCEGDEDCIDDGDVCNGEEYCDFDTERCSRRNRLPDGTECQASPRRICLGGRCDGGVCGDGYVDGESSPPEECDDWNTRDGDGCDGDCTFTCHDNSECDDGRDCSDDVCDTAGTHACTSTLSPSGTPCRPSIGECDVDESCDGISTDCPADIVVPEGTPCDDGNPLTSSSSCDGAGNCVGIIDGDDVIAYWNFDEGSGTTAADSSGHGNDGLLMDASGSPCFSGGACPTWVPGIIGAALEFDGIGDYVDCGNDTSLDLTVMTIEAWVYPYTVSTMPPDWRALVYKLNTSGGDDGGYGYLVTEDQTSISFFFESGGVFYGTADLALETWTYFVLTLDAAENYTVYINGELAGSGPISGSPPYPTTRPLYIGGNPDDDGFAPYEFEGIIDEVRIWNRPLSLDEVRAIFELAGA